MKSKLIIVSVVIAAAVGGFWLGRYFTAKSWSRYFDTYVYMEESNQAQKMVRALTYFREGKQTNALDCLELYLDGALTSFFTYGDTVPPEQRAAYVIRAAREAREYRTEHPWTNTEPSLTVAVQKVFKLAD